MAMKLSLPIPILQENQETCKIRPALQRMEEAQGGEESIEFLEMAKQGRQKLVWAMEEVLETARGDRRV